MSGAFLLGAAGALVWLAAIIVLLRVSKRSPALIVVLSAALVYLAVLVVELAAGQPLAFWPLSAAYGFLTLCVLMAFGALYKSVSLRMLGDLSKAAGWALPEQELLARYIEEDSFGRRWRSCSNRDTPNARRKGSRSRARVTASPPPSLGCSRRSPFARAGEWTALPALMLMSIAARGEHKSFRWLGGAAMRLEA